MGAVTACIVFSFLLSILPSHPIFRWHPLALQHAWAQPSWFLDYIFVALTVFRPDQPIGQIGYGPFRVLVHRSNGGDRARFSCPGWAGQVCGSTCNSCARSVGSSTASFPSLCQLQWQGRSRLLSKLGAGQQAELPPFLPLGLILGCAFRFTPWLSGATHRRSPLPHVKWHEATLDRYITIDLSC